MSIKPLATTLLLSVAYLIPNPLLAQKTEKGTRSKAPFEMHVWPGQVVVYGNNSIPIKIALKNRTNRDAYIRLWFWPVPFGATTDLHCLRLRCRNQLTGKEVSYKWPPPGRTVADAQGKELPAKIPPSKSIIDPINLRDFCVLPPGKYVVELQYDTRFTPSWIKSDKRAWHGVTNKVTVRLQILKRHI